MTSRRTLDENTAKRILLMIDGRRARIHEAWAQEERGTLESAELLGRDQELMDLKWAIQDMMNGDSGDASSAEI